MKRILVLLAILIASCAPAQPPDARADDPQVVISQENEWETIATLLLGEFVQLDEQYNQLDIYVTASTGESTTSTCGATVTSVSHKQELMNVTAFPTIDQALPKYFVYTTENINGERLVKLQCTFAEEGVELIVSVKPAARK